jgi:hypothetical protein
MDDAEARKEIAMLDMTFDEYISIRKTDPNTPLIVQIQRAKSIASVIGHYYAARYLAKRGWSIEAACWILLRKDARIAQSTS